MNRDGETSWVGSELRDVDRAADRPVPPDLVGKPAVRSQLA